MKIKSFRVQKFRSIVDSGSIDLQDDVTCLVGKNEAGKSALLEALYLFNPAYGETWDIDNQYPVWLKVQDRKKKNLEDTDVISITFDIEDVDVQAVSDVLGPRVVKTQVATITEKYSQARYWNNFKHDEAAAIKNLVKSMPKNIQALLQNKDLPAIRETISSLKAEDGVVQDDVTVAKSALTESRLAEDDVWGVVSSIIRERMPKFFRFTNYSTLPGRIDFSELSNATESHENYEGLKTAQSLLGLAGTDVEQLTNDDYELRKSELEAVQIDLTNQVFEYWKQNPNLEVNIDVDKETQQNGNGRQAVARYLDIRLKDKRTGYSNNFNQRSSGFQWFFSFLAAFSEFESGSIPVVLLDEPALTLHGKAQADFLRFINERLAVDSPVLYTTHSPFMVEASRIERVRIVEDKGPPEGTIVTDKASVSDRDSLFPMQAALGYDIAQNLFVGPNNLVVEGTSELIYMQTISRICEEKSMDSLDVKWRILPAGGATNIPTFVSLLGPHLDITVFADTNATGMGRVRNMIDAGLMDSSRLFLPNKFCNVKNADTEDLFEPEEYLSYYNATFGTKHTLDKLPKDSRIIKRIEKLDGGFDHGRVAETFLREHSKVSISDKALARFATLFDAINATLSD